MQAWLLRGVEPQVAWVCWHQLAAHCLDCCVIVGRCCCCLMGPVLPCMGTAKAAV